MVMSAAQRYPAQHSPTSSASSTTTPTSPYFTQHSRPQPYHIHQPPEPRQGSSSVGTPTISHYPRPSTPPLFRPPHNQSFASYLRSWRNNEITAFLSTCKCAHYAGVFAQHDIDGKVLLDLDMVALKDIGVSKVGERVKLLSAIKDLRKRVARSNAEWRQASETSLAVPPSGVTRLQSTRPPPLDLQPHVARNLPQAYQQTPVQRPVQRPSITSQTSSTATVTPTPFTTIPAPSRPSHLNLRAPPPRDGVRRSPSPINPDASSFIDRPLPPAPGQTSAAEYASSIRQAEGRSPHSARPVPVPGHPGHRKNPSLSIVPGRTSPVRSKFPGMVGRGNTSSGPVHPFAAKREDEPQHSASSNGSSHKRNPTGGYVVGSGGMLTNKTSSTTSRRTGSSEPVQGTLSLEDLRKQLVKFINSEDGTTRTVNVSSCSSGVEVLERVLKKFGKWNTGAVSTDTESDEDGDTLEVDGWGVYADAEDAKPLSEAALLGICLSIRDGSAVRDRGLVLRRALKVQHYRKNMEEFFGEAPPPPMSPTSPFAGPRLGITQDIKRMNRASTVSIMSGLGVVEPPSPGTSRSPSSGSFLTKSKKMYNFFGHRPPSELISNHLSEYFPSAKKKELEKTLRHSMVRMSLGPGSIKRVSIAPSEKFEVSLPKLERISPKRMSRAVASPPASTIPEEAEEEIPRVSITHEEDPPLLSAFEPSKESLSESLQAYSPTPQQKRRSTLMRRGSAGSGKSRRSMLSQLRRNRDRSDTASMLTVDEITREVENRRASTITFDESEEEEVDVPAVVDPGVAPTSEEDESGADDESESESEASEDESEESEEDTDEDGDEEHGKAFTSTGSKRIIKWIKGALIGAGSFGQVFLGMDAREGLLMAVKQVELPGGNTRNEERKRSMVDALEREIELLKDLQHENIVQYLDSSADGNFLNIFLEYVPGGSVAALLNNYGAFEEALVRNFTRQILMGLNYLHEREIIHRDIKGANILVDNKGGIKISDFGISKKVENNLMAGIKSHRPSLQGSVFWMAPEIVKQTSYTLKADIWSVGSVVVEMLTGTHPWAELTQMQAIFKIGSSARPITPSDITPEAADFLDRTFEIDYTARPTAAELLSHAFIAKVQGGLVPESVAQAAMSAAAANRGMPSLSAMAR